MSDCEACEGSGPGPLGLGCIDCTDGALPDSKTADEGVCGDWPAPCNHEEPHGKPPAPSGETEAVEALAVAMCNDCTEPHMYRGKHNATKYGPCDDHHEAARWLLASDWYRDTIAAAKAEGARELAERVEAILADHYHADTCGSVLTPNSGYECTCWKRDLRAALNDGGGR